MHLLYRSNNFWKAAWKFSCVRMSMTFVTVSFITSIVSWRQLLSLGNNQKSQGCKAWTIGRLKHRLDAHLGQIVCDRDRVVDWCIFLVEMPLTRFEECWPLPTKTSSWTPLKSQHRNLNPNPLANQLCSIDFLTPLTPLIIPQTPCLPWFSYVTQKLMLDSCNMVEK